MKRVEDAFIFHPLHPFMLFLLPGDDGEGFEYLKRHCNVKEKICLLYEYEFHFHHSPTSTNEAEAKAKSNLNPR